MKDFASFKGTGVSQDFLSEAQTVAAQMDGKSENEMVKAKTRFCAIYMPVPWKASGQERSRMSRSMRLLRSLHPCWMREKEKSFTKWQRKSSGCDRNVLQGREQSVRLRYSLKRREGGTHQSARKRV